MPEVDKMGQLIASISKGALDRLEWLMFLHEKEKYITDEVKAAFEMFYNWVENALSAEEWKEMGLDPIILEHSLCKLKRAKPILEP